MRVLVLRLGHRPFRDKRVTTHVGLVARALGAEGMLLTVEDPGVIASIKKVVEEWGGDFLVKVVSDWKSYIRTWDGKVVHLTMYGLPLNEVVDKIQSDEEAQEILVIVGSEKVPRSVFDIADYNVSVTNQPHSEIAALSLFLDRLFSGEEFSKDFDGRLKIVPSERAKRLMD